MTAKPPPPTVDDGASDPEKTLVDVEAPTDKVTKDELVGQAASDFPDGGLSAWLTVLGVRPCPSPCLARSKRRPQFFCIVRVSSLAASAAHLTTHSPLSHGGTSPLSAPFSAT
jgi:hypothetical protein